MGALSYADGTPTEKSITSAPSHNSAPLLELIGTHVRAGRVRQLHLDDLAGERALIFEIVYRRAGDDPKPHRAMAASGGLV